MKNQNMKTDRATHWRNSVDFNFSSGGGGGERGWSRISNIYNLLPCRFFVAISNAPKQIRKRIEVSKDFTLSSIRRSSVKIFISCSDTGICHQIQGGVKHKNNCTKHEKEIKYKPLSKYKRTGESRAGKKVLETANPLPHPTIPWAPHYLKVWIRQWKGSTDGQTWKGLKRIAMVVFENLLA